MQSGLYIAITYWDKYVITYDYIEGFYDISLNKIKTNVALFDNYGYSLL